MGLALTSLGHSVDLAVGGPDAVAQASSGSFDCILLDLMLPGFDGFKVARRVRATSKVPIIMLTARSDPMDVVAGLEVGADDYVTKPTLLRVLDARIRALLRRAAPHDVDALTVGDLRIDVAGMTAWREGRDLGLTATEMRLLAEFRPQPRQGADPQRPAGPCLGLRLLRRLASGRCRGPAAPGED